MDEVDAAIIGAGAVGLAIAAEVSKSRDVVVLERHAAFGQETSSRNSEVIHAGIYYPQGSLKALLCVEGAAMLYARCAERGIPFKKTGKLIVAAPGGGQGDMDELEALLNSGRLNGVSGLSIIDEAEVRRMEPRVIARAALYSQHTGIIDTHLLMKDLMHEAEGAGAMFAMGSDVAMVEPAEGGVVIGLKEDGYRLRARTLINAAGLGAPQVAALAGIDIDAAGYRLRPCKGSYFSYQKAAPVSMLVYPLPQKDPPALGVHATPDMGGRVRFGPDAEYVDKIDYTVDASKRDIFYESASRFISGLERDALVPDMAGIRPRLAGDTLRDFVIRHETDRGLPGMISLMGMESPGLTACLAIGRMVAGMVKEIA